MALETKLPDCETYETFDSLISKEIIKEDYSHLCKYVLECEEGCGSKRCYLKNCHKCDYYINFERRCI